MSQGACVPPAAIGAPTQGAEGTLLRSRTAFKKEGGKKGAGGSFFFACEPRVRACAWQLVRARRRGREGEGENGERRALQVAQAEGARRAAEAWLRLTGGATCASLTGWQVYRRACTPSRSPTWPFLVRPCFFFPSLFSFLCLDNLIDDLNHNCRRTKCKKKKQKPKHQPKI